MVGRPLVAALFRLEDQDGFRVVVDQLGQSVRTSTIACRTAMITNTPEYPSGDDRSRHLTWPTID